MLQKLLYLNLLVLLFAPSIFAKPVLLTIGDSLTFGLGVAPEKTWPQLLENKLREDGFKDAKVINAGTSGATSAFGVSVLKFHLKHERPDLIVYALGANDGLRAIDTETTYRNVRDAIAEIQKAKIKVVLLGMKAPPNYGDKFPKDFAKIFSRVAAETKVPFIPFFLEGIAGDRTLNQSDGIHPTELGYQHVLANIYPTIKGQL